MHYIHFDDLIRAAVVEREARKVPKSDWMALLGLGSSAIFALLSKDVGFSALIDRTRRATGWRLRPAGLVPARPNRGLPSAGASTGCYEAVSGGSTPEPSEDLPSPLSAAQHARETEWVAFSKLISISVAIATGKRTPEQMAGLFGLEVGRIDAIMAALKLWLPQAAQPGKRATVEASSGLVSMSLSSETELLMQRAEAWMRTKAGRDPVGLHADLEFLLQCYDRRDRDFHVREAFELKRLAMLFSELGLNPLAVRLIVRTLDPSNPEAGLSSWARPEVLGTYVACDVRYIGVRVAAKAASYAKWRGIMPVTATGESCSSVIAVAAAMGLSH